MMLGYHFFDYRDNIQNFKPAFFSIPHIIFIVLALVGTPLACFFLRKINHKKIDIFLKVFSIFVVVMEVTIILWDTLNQIKLGVGFDAGTELPLYACSLFIYTLLGAAWGKGKIKEYSLSFLTTAGIPCGLVGIMYTSSLNNYPFWTFGAFYTMYFHLSMFATGMFLLFTRYKKLEWIDMIRAWFPVLILSIIATPVNYTYGADYMQTYSAKGVPLLSSFASLLASNNLRWLFTIIMTALYIPIAAIPVCISKLIDFIVKKVGDKKIKPESNDAEAKQVSETEN